MKDIHKNKTELFNIELKALSLLIVPATFSLIFYLLKTYAFVNTNFIVEAFLSTGFSTCYFFSCFFAPSGVLILICGLIFRIALIISDRKKREEI
ncbi:hypothetical protein AL052_25370 [Pseudomonas amygdali pv. eriobotryae]|nr:hypothetical protein AL052_25370 [Pseudomonas amygdali pv. eriobotryae]